MPPLRVAFGTRSERSSLLHLVRLSLACPCPPLKASGASPPRLSAPNARSRALSDPSLSPPRLPCIATQRRHTRCPPPFPPSLGVARRSDFALLRFERIFFPAPALVSVSLSRMRLPPHSFFRTHVCARAAPNVTWTDTTRSRVLANQGKRDKTASATGEDKATSNERNGKVGKGEQGDGANDHEPCRLWGERPRAVPPSGLVEAATSGGNRGFNSASSRWERSTGKRTKRGKRPVARAHGLVLCVTGGTRGQRGHTDPGVAVTNDGKPEQGRTQTVRKQKSAEKREENAGVNGNGEMKHEAGICVERGGKKKKKRRWA